MVDILHVQRKFIKQTLHFVFKKITDSLFLSLMDKVGMMLQDVQLITTQFYSDFTSVYRLYLLLSNSTINAFYLNPMDNHRSTFVAFSCIKGFFYFRGF